MKSFSSLKKRMRAVFVTVSVAPFFPLLLTLFIFVILLSIADEDDE